MSTTIQCPHCKAEISVDQALSHQIESTLKLQYAQKTEQELAEYRKKMLTWQQEKEVTLKSELTKKLKKDLLETSAKETKLLQEELDHKKQELAKAQELELQLRKQKNQLDEDKRTFELDKQRQLDLERTKIQEEAARKAQEEHRLKEAEKDKQIDGMKKTIAELQLKANLTSQQLQGEVQELELEQMLQAEFPLDEIIPVGKGITGADVTQKVHDQNGAFCGVIVWESKRTKNWTDSWIPKLKDDLQLMKGDVAVLVSNVLPVGISTFGFKEGVYICGVDCYLNVAKVLRMTIVKEAQIKRSVIGKNEKMEVIYNYLSGNEFRQRIEAIVEAFSSMKMDLEQEKRAFQKIWAKREKEIERVINNTVGMHGDLQGLMGASLPQIKGLELDNFELVGTTEVMINSDNKTVIQTEFVSVEEV